MRTTTYQIITQSNFKPGRMETKKEGEKGRKGERKEKIKGQRERGRKDESKTKVKS